MVMQHDESRPADVRHSYDLSAWLRSTLPYPIANPHQLAPRWLDRYAEWNRAPPLPRPRSTQADRLRASALSGLGTASTDMACHTAKEADNPSNLNRRGGLVVRPA